MVALVIVLIIVIVVIVIGGGVWLVMTVGSGRTPTQPVRETRPAELLGPGGPDDPDAAR
jgi:flagellar basal body-associated protein FliL